MSLLSIPLPSIESLGMIPIANEPNLSIEMLMEIQSHHTLGYFFTFSMPKHILDLKYYLIIGKHGQEEHKDTTGTTGLFLY